MRTLLLPLVLTVFAAAPTEAPIFIAPDEPALAQARQLLDRFAATLATTRSATARLETWCAEQHLAAEPHVLAVVERGEGVRPTDEQRAHLDIGRHEAVAYRRVRLTCGGRTLSEAENWYVPARLTPEMRDALAGDVPFGAAIAPLRPIRRTLSSDRMWSPPTAADAPVAVPRELFRHRALVLDASGRPLAEVAETYLGTLLASLSVR